jgi:hypothetical protein
MPKIEQALHADRRTRFSLLSLMELVTICAVVFAFSAVMGPITSILLALMAVALFVKCGPLAIFMLAAALLAADAAPGHNTGGWQLAAFLLAGALCAWFRLRRARTDRQSTEY